MGHILEVPNNEAKPPVFHSYFYVQVNNRESGLT